MQDDYPSEPPTNELRAWDRQAESIELSYIRELNPSPPQIEAEKPLSQTEKNRLRHRFQKRKVRIMQIWREWLEFEKPLIENEPDYHKFLFDTVRAINKEKKNVWQSERRSILWNEARNRVFTPEFVDGASNRFDKSPAAIHHDVGKVASHNSWMRRLSDGQEILILQEVQSEMRELAKPKTSMPMSMPAPTVAEPTALGPVIMRAIEIKRLGAEQTKAFKEAEKAFLGDEPKQPKTATFDFLVDIDRDKRFSEQILGKKRPRTNRWKEVGREFDPT